VRLGVGPLSATVNLTAAGSALGAAVARAAPGITSNSPEAHFTRNALSDVAHLPLMVPQTAYEVTRAAADLTGGDSRRAKALAKSFTQGVYGHIARGDWNGLVDYVRQHPVYAALEVRGGPGFAGRGAGAVMRSGALGSAARRAGSTARADLELAGGTGSRVADRQHYSPDVITKALQVAGEKLRGGAGKPVLGDHRLRRRADFESDMAAATSRSVRQDEAHQARAVKPKGPLHEIVGLITQGVVRPKSVEADLRKEVARLDAEHAKPGNFSTHAQKRQNRATADAIRAVLNSPAALKNVGAAVASGRAHVRAINALEDRAAQLGAITPERAARAKLFPAAQAHLGAEYSDQPFRAARQREVQAGRELRSATTQQRQARVTYARQIASAHRNLAEKKRAYLRKDETYATLEKQHGSLRAQKESLRGPLREAERTGRKVDVQDGWTENLAGERVPKMVKRTPAQIRQRFDEIASQQRQVAGHLAARAKVLHEKPLTRTRKAPDVMYHVVRDTAVSAEAKMKGIRQHGLKPTHGVEAVYLWDNIERARDFVKGGGKILAVNTKGLDVRGSGAARTVRGRIPASRVREVGPEGVRPVKRLTARATVKRAERKVLAARATRDKPTLQTVPRARADFERARAERVAAQRGGTQSLHGPGGERLSNEAIQAAAGEPVAYLPHHTQNRGARAYYQTQFAGRKNLDASKVRTGRAFKIGAADASYNAIVEHRVRLRGVVNRIGEHDRIIHSMAIKGPGGRMMTWDQATRIAENAREHAGAKLVPYRAVPGSYDRGRLEQIAQSQNAAEMPELGRMIGQEFENRLKEPAAGDRSTANVVLLPEQVVNQLKAQQQVSSAPGRVGNVAADVFRRTVLPFSLKWLTGNTVEAGVRLAAVGAGPNALRIGRGLLKEMDSIDREQAIRVRAALTGGLLYGNRGLTVRRFAEHFEGTALATPAKALGVAGHLPVVHQLGQLMKHYTDGVFHFNRLIESSAQYAALGKYAKREMQEMTGSWLKATRAQQAALHDVAHGLLDSKNVHDAARYIDETLGQYSRFSPSMRRFIQSAAPFLPWYLNSVRWVLWTLPGKHPIKTAVMALAANNLQADYDASHKNLPPGSLRGDIVAGGKPYPSSRYTPFGAFGPVLGGGSEQLTALVDPLFPQFKGAFLAAFGLNFAGRAARIDPKSKGSQGEVPLAVKASMAVNSLLEAFVPVLGIARRVEEGGSTPYDNSTVLSPKTKPGTKVPGGAANRILNPVRPTALKARGGETVTGPTQSPASSSAGPAQTVQDAMRAAMTGSAPRQQQDTSAVEAMRAAMAGH
jgi:hypothetical protein